MTSRRQYTTLHREILNEDAERGSLAILYSVCKVHLAV
jgi:hypothetical protein